MKNVKVINELVPSVAGGVWETALYVNGVRIAAGVGKDCHHINKRAAEIMQQPTLTYDACTRFYAAQRKGMFLEDTPESLAKIILEQNIVTEYDGQISVSFDLDDLK